MGDPMAARRRRAVWPARALKSFSAKTWPSVGGGQLTLFRMAYQTALLGRCFRALPTHVPAIQGNRLLSRDCAATQHTHLARGVRDSCAATRGARVVVSLFGERAPAARCSRRWMARRRCVLTERLCARSCASAQRRKRVAPPAPWSHPKTRRRGRIRQKPARIRQKPAEQLQSPRVRRRGSQPVMSQQDQQVVVL